MDAETWMNEHSAHDMGFCDKVMYTENSDSDIAENMIVDKTAMVTNTVAAMRKKLKPIEKSDNTGIDIGQFETRLNLLK